MGEYRNQALEILLKRPSAFVTVLFAGLLVANLITIPQFVSPHNLAGTLAVAAPFVLAAIASTLPVLSGGGGIDLSVGPLLGFSNVLFIGWLMPHGYAGPETAIPFLLLLGAGVGLINGLLVAVLRLQPIVATLGTYLVLGGLSLRVMPQPIGEAPSWIVRFDGSFAGVPGALILVAFPVAVWVLLRRTAYAKALYSVGGDERAAFTAGIDLRLVRIVSYVLAGIFAAVAGLALTALIQSGDPTIGTQYTLIAIAAVALGGTSLAGGRGGLTGSILGALTIFLIQNFLSAINVSALWLQVVYGAILVFALVANSQARTFAKRHPAGVSAPSTIGPAA
jgi:ribose transport system permease protein